MRTSIFILVAVLLISGIAICGEYNKTLPLNIKQAYDKKTRSMDGLPGAEYWQNHADYEIDVTLDPKSGLVSASADIVYYNDSPDELTEIVIRLYQDFYKKGNARDFPVEEADLTDGTNIKVLEVDGDKIDLSAESEAVKRTATNLIVKLETPLKSKEKIEIECEWEFVLSSNRKVRMGKYSDRALFVAYWYPQIAVYDDISGWDKLDYHGAVEFYNDFNNYDVKITVPGDFFVWATGELKNAKKVLNSEIYSRYQKAHTTENVIQVVSQVDYTFEQATNGKDENEWHYVAKSVPDFSFSCSNNYTWDGVSALVDPQNGKRVLVNAVYPDSAAHWHEVAMITKTALEYFSQERPGLPYPYPHMTSFCNGTAKGGMESPMMANNGQPLDRPRAIGLITHEVFHSYFPFYMGTNERKYAWMDEGWATYFPLAVNQKIDPAEDFLKRTVKRYDTTLGKDSDMPLMVPSYLISNYVSLRAASYARPAMAYMVLEDILGKDVFKKSMLVFMNRWAGKHPLPYDFFNTIENVSGKDLSWFWKPWFYDFGYPDLAIKGVAAHKDRLLVQVEKIGKLPVPIRLVFVYEDGTSEVDYYSALAWQDGVNLFSARFYPGKQVVRIYLDSDHVPDADSTNNEWVKE